VVRGIRRLNRMAVRSRDKKDVSSRGEVNDGGKKMTDRYFEKKHGGSVYQTLEKAGRSRDDDEQFLNEQSQRADTGRRQLLLRLTINTQQAHRRSTRTAQPVATCRLSPPPASPCCRPWGPGRVGMRLSVYFGKRLHGMLSRTHVHV